MSEPNNRLRCSPLIAALLGTVSCAAWAEPYLNVITPTQFIAYDLADGSEEHRFSLELPSAYSAFSLVGFDWDPSTEQPWALAYSASAGCRLFTYTGPSPDDGATSLTLEPVLDAFDCPGAGSEFEVVGGDSDAFLSAGGDEVVLIQTDGDAGASLGLTVGGSPADVRGMAMMSQWEFGGDRDRVLAVDAALGALVDYTEAFAQAGGGEGGPEDIPAALDAEIVGSLGVSLSGNTSFDVGPPGDPTAILLTGGNLYSVNLDTGGAALLFAAPAGAVAAAIEPFLDDDGGDGSGGGGDGGGGDGSGGDGGGGGGGDGGGDDGDDDGSGAVGLWSLAALLAAVTLRRRRRGRWA